MTNFITGFIGVAGILSVVPVLKDLGYVFGLLEIVWFVWLGIVMLRTKGGSEPILQGGTR